jgi:hypothetical protein
MVQRTQELLVSNQQPHNIVQKWPQLIAVDAAAQRH